MPADNLSDLGGGQSGNSSEEKMISLAELGNLDVNQVAELRFENLPQMAGEFEIVDAGMELFAEKPAIWIESAVRVIHSVLDEEVQNNPEKIADLMTKKHREVFFPKEPKDVGRFKAWIIDAGVTISGPALLPELLSALKKSHLRYPGKIVHQKDKNDPEKFYAKMHPTPMKQRQQAA